jgi:predicted dehydrogenase
LTTAFHLHNSSEETEPDPSFNVTDISSCRIVFVGAGAMINEHAKAFAAVPGSVLAGIWNRTRSRAEALAGKHGIAAVYDDLAEMLTDTAPDLVVLAVYETAILDVVTTVLANPAKLFIEKPVGLDLDAARQIDGLAREHGREVYVGLNRRCMSSTLATLADLEDRAGPRHVYVQDQQSLETARAIGHAEPVVQNWMFANSIHIIDYLNCFCRGEITQVQCLRPWTPDEPQTVVAAVTYSSGDFGIYEAIWNGPGPWACAVSTPARRWEMRPLEKAVFQNAGERSLNDVTQASEDTDFKPGFLVQAQRVVGAVRGEDTGAVDLAEALRTTELVAQIYSKSVQAGG